jgi:EpsI family protein
LNPPAADPLRRAVLVLAAAAGAAALSARLKPARHMAHGRERKALADWLPRRLPSWQEDPRQPITVAPPDVKAQLDRVYQDLLARTYAHRDGYRVMASLAYSGDQSDGMAVHRPEVCYPAQGFELTRVWDEELALPGARIPVRRATTRNGSRVEPLTYWIVLGEDVVVDSWQGRWRHLQWSLRGTVPDGLLVRLSSLDDDAPRAFAMHDALARELVAAVDAGFRPRLAGKAAGGIVRMDQSASIGR